MRKETEDSGKRGREQNEKKRDRVRGETVRVEVRDIEKGGGTE